MVNCAILTVAPRVSARPNTQSQRSMASTLPSNPYQSPTSPDEDPAVAPDRERRPGVSVVMIAVGLFFFIASFYVLFGHGIAAFLASYRTIGPWAFGFMTFYGFTGALTALFHLAYLISGRPKQHWASFLAIGFALGLSSIAVLAVELWL
jgi:hypothetical protein